MFNAIIIDDEYIFRQSLMTTFPWQDYEINICGDCSNSPDALEFLKRFHPDIAFVDINMPGMNGLEFIKEAKNISPSTNYIIISGYNDFAYAQEAISLGVVKYLLKPLRHEELKATLETLLSQITLNNNRVTDLYERHNHFLNVLRRQFLSNLISFGNKLGEKSVEENCNFLELSWNHKKHFYVIYLETNKVTAKKTLTDSTINNYQIIEHLQNELILPFDGCACETSNSQLALLFATDLPLENDLMTSELKRIHLVLYDLTGQEFHFGVSGVATQLSEIPHAATQAYEALRKYQPGISESIQFYNIEKTNSMFSTQRLIQFNVFLRMGEYSKVSEILDELEVELKNSKLSEQLLISIHIDYMRCILEIANENQLDSLSELILSEIRILSPPITAETVIQKLQLRSRSLLEAMKKKYVQKQSPIVEQTVTYINEHYSDPDLTVGTIAKALHINYAHLCSVFSRETDITINQYIKQLRLIRSQELMDQGVTSVSEISKAVGFQNTNYFSKCFKKEFTVSPSDYLNAISTNLSIDK